MNDSWSDIFGHQQNKDFILQIVNSSRIPHAMVFAGKQGIGKDFFAIKFAEELNKKFAPSVELPTIISGLRNLNEPYIKYVFALPRGKNEDDESAPLEKISKEDLEEIKAQLKLKISNPYHRIQLQKANIIKVNSIRDIGKFLSLQFDKSYFRLVLISDAHLMNETSQNALLKNLEEPPENVIFILTTPYPNLLRETIRSRCWLMAFNPLDSKDVRDILVKYYNVSPKLAEGAAYFSDGSVTTALQLIENDFQNLKDRTISFLRFSLGGKFNSAYSEILNLIRGGNTISLRLFLQMIITWLNDSVREKNANPEISFIDYKETLQKFNSRFRNVNVLELAAKLDGLSSLIQNNINQNLIAANLIYNLAAIKKNN